MAAHWIPDGSEIPLLCAAGPRNRWRTGSYAFERWPRAESGPGSGGRWGCCYRSSRGVANYRSPLGAFLGLRRELRKPPAPPPGE
jgi:hypothetical protein